MTFVAGLLVGGIFGVFCWFVDKVRREYQEEKRHRSDEEYALRRKLIEARDALEFYASPKLYKVCGCGDVSAIEKDAGAYARRVLELP